MRMLVLDGYGITLAASHGALVVRGRDGRRSIPLSDIDVVIVATSGVSVTSSAVRLLASSGIELVVLDHRGMPVSILYASHYTRTPATRRAQYEALHNGLAPRIIREIAYSKVWNQTCILRRLRHHSPMEVDEALDSITGVLGDIASGPPDEGVDEARRWAIHLEAMAARAYWSGIAAVLPGDLGFDGRDQDAPDPVNAALNYGYGILYSIAWRSLVLAGLDPYAGFLHVDRSGKPVLAFDYVEIFRAHIVDWPLVQLLLRGWKPVYTEGRLDPDSRRRIAEEVNKALSSSTRGRKLENIIRGNALELARSLRAGREYRAWRGC